MPELDNHGRRLLDYLVNNILPRVTPDRLNTYVNYQQIHKDLNLPLMGITYGQSLQLQGLNNLAEWTHGENKPAITGLIIDQTTMQPGNGYFDIFHRRNDDYGWWNEQITLSMGHNWNAYLVQGEPAAMPTEIGVIAAELNRLSQNHPFGRFQEIRKNLKNLQRLPGRKIFGDITINDDYAFHYGGRTELQFNIGKEKEHLGELRYGVAFSLELSQTLPSIDELVPKIRLFNEFMHSFSDKYADMRMWHFQDGVRSNDYPASSIMPELVKENTFIFLGKHQLIEELSLETIINDFDRLLPLYIYVENQGHDLVSEMEENQNFNFVPGFSQKPSASQREYAIKQLDINLRHNDLQFALCKQLANEHGDDKVKAEYITPSGAQIDVALMIGNNEFIYYEIKTALSPRACIREAIGQLLEYSYWPGTYQAKQLYICGESVLDAQGREYLDKIKNEFKLPIDYLQIKISDLN